MSIDQFPVAMYEELGRAEILTEDDKVELLDGYVVRKLARTAAGLQLLTNFAWSCSNCSLMVGMSAPMARSSPPTAFKSPIQPSSLRSANRGCFRLGPDNHEGLELLQLAVGVLVGSDALHYLLVLALDLSGDGRVAGLDFHGAIRFQLSLG